MNPLTQKNAFWKRFLKKKRISKDDEVSLVETHVDFLARQMNAMFPSSVYGGLTQGRSGAGLDWDGLGALGYGVPVLGVEGPMTATSMYDEK